MLALRRRGRGREEVGLVIFVFVFVSVLVVEGEGVLVVVDFLRDEGRTAERAAVRRRVVTGIVLFRRFQRLWLVWWRCYCCWYQGWSLRAVVSL